MRRTDCPTRSRTTAALGLAGLGLTLGLTAGPASADPGPAAARPVAGPTTSHLGVRPNAIVGTELRTGGTLAPGDALQSPSGGYLLLMSTDGALLLEKAPNRLDPEPYTLEYLGFGAPGSRLVLQADGNLVGYQADGTVFFTSDTRRDDGQRLVVQDDRNVVLYRTATNTPDFSFETFGDQDFLQPGGTLLPGESLTSADHGTTLLMQTDGNLVLYRAGKALFATGTSVPGSGAVLQADGNTVVYTPAGAAVFSTSSARPGPSGGFLQVTDGEFRVFDDAGDGAVVFGSAWRTSTLEPGQKLLQGDRRTAPGGVVLVMQADGNLVEYVNGRPRFASGTRGVTTLMQPDGNLVVYGLDRRNAFRPLFATRTSVPGSRLVVQSDGNLVVYTPAGRAVYASQH